MSNRDCLYAGIYYPKEKDILENYVNETISLFKDKKVDSPFAIVAPTADYKSSRRAFGISYSQLIDERYDTAIIISPIYRIAFDGFVLADFDSYSSPLGDSFVDREANDILVNFNGEFITYNNNYHTKEYNIELQLPFIQSVLGFDTKILPIIMGKTNTKFTIMLSKALSTLLSKSGNKKILIVVIMNLSKGLPLSKVVEKDSKFVEVLSKLNIDHFSEQLSIGTIEAFGAGGLIAVLRLLDTLSLEKIKILDLSNSSVVGEDNNKVDGYISIAIS
jgi:AmmeMemoRadiSam system protein B